MSFPASLTVVTVTGTLLDAAGNPRQGKVLFRTAGFTMSGPDDTFVVPRVVAAFLDGAGHFSIALPSGNDPDWVPSGWTYRVTIDLGDDGRTFLGDILVPYNLGGTISLASLAPVPAANGQLYALYNDPRFNGIGGGGGGAVTSVFGRAGVVTAQTGDYTKAQVGLGNVDNISDINKPVSTAQAAADATVAANASSALTTGLSGKAATVHTHAEADVTSLVSDLGAIATSLSGKAATVHSHVEGDVTSLVADLALKAPIASPTFTGTVGGVTAAMVGLGNVNNTSDANKPVSTAQQTALDGKQPLDADLTAIAALTATTGNVIQSVASAWSSVTPSSLKTSLALVKADVGLGSVSNALQLVAANNLSDLVTPATARTNIGLGSVDNTSDVGKPVSTAQQNALNLKANIASPTFTGTVSGITAAMVSAVPLATVTTKGDLYVATASGAVSRLGVGADTQVLTADSTQATGVKWGAAGGAGSYSFPDSIDPPSGDYHAVPNGPVGSNLTTFLARAYFVPIPMGPNSRTLNEASIEVATAGAAGTVFRLVLWSATGRRPNVSLVDFGTVAGDTTGVKKWLSLTQVMSANTLYWGMLVEQVATGAAVKAISAYNSYVTLHGADLAGSSAFGAYAMASVSGAVTNGTAFTYFDVDSAPRLGLKFA
jgi:hypothetical protein